MNLSVVVCTFNRSESLTKTLGSLSEQSLPESVAWEVLVVDNNSRDGTREIAEEFCRRFPGQFRYIFEPQQGKSYALNRAIREAHGNIVAFTDDDVTLDPKWLHELTADLYSEEWAGAGGRTLPERGFVPPRWLAMRVRYALAPLAIFDMGSEPRELKEAPFGNNMAFRKAVLEKYKGFRIDLGPCAGSSRPQKSEDSEFGTRLLLAGERLRYEPSAVVYHNVPQGRIEKRYFLQWWFDKAGADIQAFGVPDPAWCVAGVPSRLFRRLVVWTVLWLSAVEPSRRFDCKIKVWSLLGEIRECYRWRLGARGEKESDVRA
jgi:glycosyltransferase involved in cell wall biosynthesis